MASLYWYRLALGTLRLSTGILAGATGIGRQLSAFFARHNRPRRVTESYRLLQTELEEHSSLPRSSPRLARLDARRSD